MLEGIITFVQTSWVGVLAWVVVFVVITRSKLPNVGKGLGSMLMLVAVALSVYAVGQRTSFLGEAEGVEANILVDASVVYDPVSFVWRNLAQGGEEPNSRMLASVVGDVANLSPKYIRIDHIYDYYDVVTRASGGGLEFDWGYLDQTVADILSTGAKPFFSLSYMPPVISSGGVTDLPREWSEWETVVQKTVEHYSGMGGMGISDVYYEVWNEPDLFGGFGVSGAKSYLELYLHSVRGAERAGSVASFRMGGPGTTSHYPAWMSGMLDYVSVNGLRMDFYSFHKYSARMSDFEKDMASISSLLSSYSGYSGLELVNSEWGFDSENNAGHDGYFSAIHTLAGIATMSSSFPGVDKAFAFEIKDGPGPEKYWGRWGILTHEKYGEVTRKPRYEAMKFLNGMGGGQLVLAGQGTWVKGLAGKEGGVVRVMIVNYDPVGRHEEAVPLRVVGLEDGQYLLRRTEFAGGVKEVRILVEGSAWETLQEFAANSAAIFEFFPL